MNALSADSEAAWSGRAKRNVWLYVWIYGLLGAVTGITNYAMMSYYQIVAPQLVKGFNLYSSIGTLILSLLIALIHRTGFKKIMLIAPPITVAALVITVITNNVPLIIIMCIASTITIGIYDYLYPIMFAVYIPRKKQTKWMTYILVDNLVCQTVLTFLGGKLVVYFFALLQHVSYGKASALSAHQEAMHGAMLANYTMAYRWVIVIAAVLAGLAFIFALFFREKPSDYRETPIERERDEAAQRPSNFKQLMTKTVLIWVLYLVLVRFGALLVTPYFPIYLNNYLHMPRGVAATVNTFQNAAMFLGYLVAPFLEKKLGSIVSMAAAGITVAPMMILMANGRALGTGTVAVIIVGVVLFLRSGIANATAPIQQSLQMAMVSKDLRPAFSSVISLVNALMGVVSGLFCTFFLFKSLSGYATAYYIAGALYVVAGVFILIFFKKKYNRIMDEVPTQAESDAAVAEKENGEE